MSLSNRELAHLFALTGLLLDLHNGNPFKVKSYANAAYAIKKYELPILELTTDELLRIQGFGRGLLVKIEELKENGQIAELNDLMAKTPSGIIDLLELPGVGAKKVRLLWQELGITNLGELAYACNENKLISLPGFGEKTQTKVLEAINFKLSNQGKMRLNDAIALQNHCVNLIKQQLENCIVFEAGPIRRRCELIDCINLVVQTESTTNNPSTPILFSDFLQNSPFEKTALPVYLYMANAKNVGSALFVATTSAEWLSKFEIDLNTILNFKTEIEIFDALNLPFIEPELREINYEKSDFEAFEQLKLVEFSNFKGCIHNHTTYSDGMHTLSEMADASIAMGLSYLVICDHSQAAFYANGLKPDMVVKQWAEIDSLNKKLAPFKIFKGIEADILADGSLDYDAELLNGFDLVVASVHSNLQMTSEKATQRLLNAIKNPFTSILGHPTGRLLAARQGYEPDMDLIFDACKNHQVVIELNANPYRLDIDWRYLWRLKQLGISISINPDAHRISGLLDMQFGAWVARKGGIEPINVLNCMDLATFEDFIASQKEKRKL